LFFFVCAGVTLCFAGDTLTHHHPSAVLVQLRSEQNRIKAMEKAHDYKRLAQVEKDALGVRAAMVNDFKNHFDYCPVYYYMDSNLALIKKREFKGALMDTDGTQAKNIALNDTSTDYLVVYYGYPTAQARYKKVVTDPKKYEYNSGEPSGKGLIINNYKFQQVSFYYLFGYDHLFFKKGSKRFNNAYESKHYDIEYFPCAEKLNKELYEWPEKIRISRFIHDRQS